jgi:cyanate permease
MTPIGSRKLLICFALFGIAACTVGTVLIPVNSVILTLISISMFLVYVASSAAWAAVPIAAPSHFTASLGSIQNFGGYLGGALAPMLTGFIVQRTGSFSRALLLSAAITVAGGIAYLVLVGRPIQVEPSGAPDAAGSLSKAQ